MAEGKKKKKRAPKLWEISYYDSALQHSMDIREVIMEALGEDKSLDELNATTINTEILFYITDALIGSYHRLLEQELINTGNLAKVRPTQH